MNHTVGDNVGESVLLHFLLQIDGQKNFNSLSVPGCSFLHLFLGFFATYESHENSGLSLNRNESEFVQSPRFTVGEDVGDDAVNDFGDDDGELVSLGTKLGFKLRTALGLLLGSSIGAEIGASLGD